MPDVIRVEAKWGPLKHASEFQYHRLVSRSVKERRSPFAAVLVFAVLVCVPVAFGGFASAMGVPEFHAGTVLFAIPALIAFREIVRSCRHEVLFLEKGDGGVAIRFSYVGGEKESVEAFIQELRKRISAAKKK